jgi:hypothetical protein
MFVYLIFIVFNVLLITLILLLLLINVLQLYGWYICNSVPNSNTISICITLLILVNLSFLKICYRRSILLLSQVGICSSAFASLILSHILLLLLNWCSTTKLSVLCSCIHINSLLCKLKCLWLCTHHFLLSLHTLIVCCACKQLRLL